MKAFEDRSTEGNEKAFRRGVRVPEDAVNLAWIQSPSLTPSKNVVIVDTSNVVEENTVSVADQYRIMYANRMGILEDESGNQIVEDEFPAVADVFTIDEDFLSTPGSEYTSDSILPYVHVSRYFHVDFQGLTLGSELRTFELEDIKVVDADGRDYVDEQGRARYKIRITPANTTVEDTDQTTDAYRVWAFVDVDDNENLYLTYNKVEVGTDGKLKNQELSYKEILNPQAYYSYRPEESDVVDLNNRNKKWYSTKPATLKEQILGEPHPDVEGYRIFVPKKAMADPRIFQLFRWRVKASFTENYTVDPSKEAAAIKAGVIITDGNRHSDATYAFLNLMRSDYNATEIQFINPLHTDEEDTASVDDQEDEDYWTVDFDDISYSDLRKFDILLWCPRVLSFDFQPYMQKIRYFTEQLGKTLIIDMHNHTVPEGLGIETTCAVNAADASRISEEGDYGWIDGGTIRPKNDEYFLWNADQEYGGWNFNDGSDDEYNSISPYKNGGYGTFGDGYCQYILDYPGDYIVLMEAQNNSGQYKPCLLHKPTLNGGHLIFSTIGSLEAVNMLFSHVTGKRVARNRFDTAGHEVSRADYNRYVNSSTVEGAYKFFYNLCLLAVKDRALDGRDETDYSTSWTFSSPWKASWVIDGEALSQREKDANRFVSLTTASATPTNVWQRILSEQTLKQIIDSSISAADLERVRGATRTYQIEVTNPNVEVPEDLGDSVIPAAWTIAYTPKFEVPIDLGPHVIREELVTGDFEEGQYVYREYPPKPYGVQVRVNYNATAQDSTEETVDWTASGTAKLTREVTEYENVTVDDDTEIIMSWSSHGKNKTTFTSGRAFDQGTKHPNYLRTWQDDNYYGDEKGTLAGGLLSWPFWGATVRLEKGGSGNISDWVKFVQMTMNKLKFFGFLKNTEYLEVNGRYDNSSNGKKTEEAIKQFQTKCHLRFRNGVVDAETWAAIGYQVINLGSLVGPTSSRDYTKFYDWPKGRIMKKHISDWNAQTYYAKRSDLKNSPGNIWDVFSVELDDRYKIHGVKITPYLEGNSKQMLLHAIDVKTHSAPGPFHLGGYDMGKARVTSLGLPIPDGPGTYFPVGPYEGNVVIVGVGQNGKSGWGDSRMLGIKDILIYGKGKKTERREVVRQVTINNYPINASGRNVVVRSGYDTTVQANPHDYASGTLSDVNWTNITVNNPKVSIVGATSSGLIRLRNNIVVNHVNSRYTFGPEYEPGSSETWYSMDENGNRRIAPESGWIRKTDGIKLLCDADGKPAGFPAMPTSVGTNETQRHYMSLSVDLTTNDASVFVGFYDKRKKEFIVNSSGIPEMTYMEYLDRGPENVYVGVISNYELNTTNTLPVSADAPKIPFRWAMPVYGVKVKSGAQIQIEPLPENLGAADVWPVPVRIGSFNRKVKIRPRNQGPLDGYLGSYQGSDVRAFYSIPESELGGWSTLHGRPNVDIKGEHPVVIDETTIQLRQAPLLMVKEPSNVSSSYADPVRPALKVYTRSTASSPWTELSWPDIADYNASTGEITLASPLASDEANLVKVDYTTKRSVYNFKQYDGRYLNLNPNPGNTRNLVGRPVYIYIVPAFVKDSNGSVITDSVNTRTLRFRMDTNIFDPLDPEYDPLAVQLGVVYIAPALDINDLVILDTRRRGGGAKDSLNLEEIRRMVSESIGYWDIGFGGGVSYQKGGFVIIRLPEELKTQFPKEQEIINVIERNITAGVRYKLEDLHGRSWT